VDDVAANSQRVEHESRTLHRGTVGEHKLGAWKEIGGGDRTGPHEGARDVAGYLNLGRAGIDDEGQFDDAIDLDTHCVDAGPPRKVNLLSSDYPEAANHDSDCRGKD